ENNRMSEIPTNTISNISLIKPRQVKSAIKLLVGITLLSANVSFAEFIFPSNLLNKRGSSTPQPLEVLAVKDQQSSDDNSDSYIEFATDQLGYVGTFRFNLPAKPDKTIQQLIFHANYRGREKSLQKWEFQLLNVKTGKWTHIADNGNVKDGFWSDILTTIIEPSQFINSRNQITLRYVTGSGGNNSQLDFVAFESAVSDSSTDTLESRNLASSQPPTVIKNGSRWQPAPGSKWQIQYTGKIDTSLGVDVYNLDLFDTSAAVISALRSTGKRVICYFSAGGHENWRPDAGSFPTAVLGRNLDGWAGERWLDIRKLDILIPIMRARMEQAAQKGCDGIDPDNVDGYSNNTGFALSYNDQLAYNVALAEAAHELGLAIGLKNNLDQIKDLVNYFDFAVNEECFQYDECNTLKPFVDAGKAVFGIEYNLANSSFCPQANTLNFDFLKKNLSLDAWRESCR
ncbi:MAG TPA: endo alpha-1,4 polygalactosaminidase, partial [Nitrosospira sp.]|nr:endo alpha-1,4 polygalactosaminidase [Nitrosospira sp.]